MPVAEPLSAIWEVRGRDGDTLQIWLAEVYHDSFHELGVDPGLQKDGVEAHLQDFSPNIPRRWHLVSPLSVENIPRRSVRSICYAGTPRGVRGGGDQTSWRD